MYEVAVTHHHYAFRMTTPAHKGGVVARHRRKADAIADAAGRETHAEVFRYRSGLVEEVFDNGKPPLVTRQCN